MLKKISAFILAICITLSICACQKQQPEAITSFSDFPIMINSVNIEKQPASVVTVSPVIAKIICDIGQQSVLIGIPDGFHDDSLGEEVQAVGSNTSPNIDKILEIAPDIVLSQRAFSVRDLQTLNDAKIQVIVIEGASNANAIKTLYQNIAMTLLGRTEGVQIANNRFQKLYNVFLEFCNNVPVPRKSYLFIISDGKVATRDTLENSLFSLIAANVVDDSFKKYAVDEETIRSYQPDVIFVNSSVGAASLEENPLYSGMEAVINDQIIEIDDDIFTYQVSDNMVTAVLNVANRLYPDVFGQISIGSDQTKETESSAETAPEEK